MMFARKKYEHCVGSDVETDVFGVLIEGEARLTWTSSVSGFSRFDIVFSS